MKAQNIATISSTNEKETDPNNAIDDDKTTYVHTMEVGNPLFESFPTLNITFE